MNTHIDKSRPRTGRYILAAALFVSALFVFGIQIGLGIDFDQHVKGRLKLAADANTVELAEEQLSMVIDHLESNGITDGFTSVWYETPTEDIGFWYRNLVASKQELQKVAGSSQLEKTNTLIKLRETLLDGGDEGKTKVTYPEGLKRYPNNLLNGSMIIYGLIALFVSMILLIPTETKKAEAD